MTKTFAIAVAGLLVSTSAFAQDASFPAPAAGEFGPHAEAPDGLTLGDMVATNNVPHTDGDGSPDIVGAFRFICDPGHVLADDPVVAPGKPGRSHPHQFYGNLATNGNSTYETQRAAGLSTCGSAGNRTGYWMPAILSGSQVIRPEQVAIYYKREPKDSAQCTPGTPEYVGICVSIPNALRFIFGADMVSGTIPTGEISFRCHLNDNASNPVRPGTVSAGNMADAAKGCRVGDFLNLKIAAPECWDGVNLDSANHRSHTANLYRKPNGLPACPTTHPYYMPHFTLQTFYKVDANLNTTDDWVPGQKTWYLSSDVMFGMAPKKPGSTFHADYFEGWNGRIKKAWTDHCIDRFLNCNDGDLGNGYSLKSIVRQGANPRYVPIPAGVTGPFMNNKLHAGH